MNINETLEVQFDGETYEFVAVNDRSINDAYVVVEDDEFPSILLRHLEENTKYDIYAPGDDEINRCAIRHVDSDHRETGIAYYLYSRPDTAVVEVEDVGALEDVEDLLMKKGHNVEYIDQAYYYPEDDSVEAWFREFTTTVDEEYPALKHRHYRTYGRVDADAEGEHVREDEDGYLSLDALGRLADKLYDDFEYDGGHADENDSVDGDDVDADVADSVLEERQRRNDIEGAYYPDQSTESQTDVDDSSGYPDSAGKPGDDRE